ncbi:MAG: 30S ribosomal protein S4 [Candidatus Aenigmarchaeota archaeon]|nr:30S ribosomal protein S4 [Candidatus Aenigmarchaeota archaeon]MCX8179429.1 30S ribosomal protein S4 [Candidatus Aenigmarchaeota archaeon]
MRKIRKNYSKPRKLWDKVRIEEEKRLMKKYGLRRKREIWRAEALLRSFRQRARNLAARKNEEEEKRLLNRLYRLGLLEKGANLNDVLSLTVEDILERRLQTMVLKKGLARTIKQARQYIVHGHIGVEGRRVKFPSFLVVREVEDKIDYYKFEPKQLMVKENE